MRQGKTREQGKRTRDCSEVPIVNEEGGWCKIKSGILLLRTDGFEKGKKKISTGQTKNGYHGEVMGCFRLPKQIACIPKQ